MKQTLTSLFFSILLAPFAQQAVAQSDCPCYDGIGASRGDAPVFTYSFTKGQPLMEVEADKH
jgi:hypothetical protein